MNGLPAIPVKVSITDFDGKRVDTIALQTDEDYVPALRTFFRTRERRMMLRA